MRIVLDVDGVLADFVGGALRIVNSLTPYNTFARHHVTEWEIESLLPEQARWAFRAQLNRPGFAAGLRPLGSEVLYARALQAWGHDVVIATSPLETSPTWVAERNEWVGWHLGGVEIYHTHDKTGVRGDIFVDDKPEHVRAWQAANPKGMAYLFDAPYNRHATDLIPIRSLDALL